MPHDDKQKSSRIKTVREFLNLSQKEFATLIGASFRTVQSYESGKSDPKGKVLEILYDLGIDINWLMTGNGEMRRQSPSEDFPLLTDLELLESVIKLVDEYFANRDFKLPKEYREKIIIEIYKDVKKEDIGLEKISLGDYFSNILSHVKA